MSPDAQGAALSRQPYVGLLRGTLLFLALLVVVRFALEILGAPHDTTRWVSSTAGVFLAAIYLAAVGPLKGGFKKLQQLLLPAVLLSVWTGGWIIVFTVISGVFRLERSHFAEAADYGNWANLGRHVLGHIIEMGVFFLAAFILMALVHLLWRWPVTVGPGALLGLLVIMRYWTEAMGVEPWRAAAWSSTVGVLFCGFYLGGVGPRLGLSTPRQLLVPGLVLGWTWRFWVFLATVMSALAPSLRTHFFDPSRGRVAIRLVQFLGASVIEGFIAGMLLWAVAVWIAHATRPAAEA
jgi:hypothetical protein